MDANAVARRLAKGASRSPGYNEESRAFNLLASFQLLELSLKVYVNLAHAVVKFRVGGLVPFEPDARALEKASLERLLAMFKVVNGNKALQKRLGGLVDKRNDIAHRMLLPHFGVERRDADFRKAHEELKQTEDSVSRAMKSLAREILAVKKVLAELAD